MEENKRMPCPRCNRAVPMRFMFPAERDDPCEELNAWRFQRCEWCGWTGDVTTDQQLDIGRDIWQGYRINGRHWDTLKEWLQSIGLC